MRIKLPGTIRTKIILMIILIIISIGILINEGINNRRQSKTEQNEVQYIYPVKSDK